MWYLLSLNGQKEIIALQRISWVSLGLTQPTIPLNRAVLGRVLYKSYL